MDWRGLQIKQQLMLSFGVLLYIQDYVIHTVISTFRNVISEQWLHWTEFVAWKHSWNEHYETGGTECGWDVAASGSWHLICCILFFFTQARNYISSLPQMPKRNFTDVFIGANPQGKRKKRFKASAITWYGGFPLIVRFFFVILAICTWHDTWILNGS